MFILHAKDLGRVRLGSIRNKNNWNNASKRLFESYSHSEIPGFPFQLFCSQEQNSQNIFRNIFLFRNIPNERALNVCSMDLVPEQEYERLLLKITSGILTLPEYKGLFQHRFRSKCFRYIFQRKIWRSFLLFLFQIRSNATLIKHFRCATSTALDKILLLPKFLFQQV